MRCLIGAVVLAMILASCVSEDQEPTVVTGSYALEESRVLAEVVRQVLERQGVATEIAPGFGSREDLIGALDRGEIDVAVEYLASYTDWLGLAASAGPSAMLGEVAVADPERSVIAVAPAHAGRGLVVRSEFAAREGVRSIAALESIAGRMVIGGPAGCPVSLTCLGGLEAAYGFGFQEFRVLANDLLLEAALASGEVDAVVLLATSPVIVENGFVVLEDDLRMQPAEAPILLARSGLLEPLVVEALAGVFAQIETGVLRGLNVQAERLGPEKAVSQFLESIGFQGG